MRETDMARSTAERVTMAEAGEELRRRLEIRGRKKSHRLTVESTCATTSPRSSENRPEPPEYGAVRLQ